MSEETPRFALPYIVAGQAQKEQFHNEALLRLDSALHAAVEGVASTPPPAPAAGECWIVGPAAAGDFAGRENEIACWSESGWRFIAPSEGMTAWNRPSALPLRYRSGAWNGGTVDCSALAVGGVQVVGSRQPAVPSPSGGTTIDAEARAAIAALTAALMSHGLIG